MSGKQYQTILDDEEHQAVQKAALELASQNVLTDRYGRRVRAVRGRVSRYALTRFALLKLTTHNGTEPAQLVTQEPNHV